VKIVLFIAALICTAAVVLSLSSTAEREFRTYSMQNDPDLRISLASNAIVRVAGMAHHMRTEGVFEMRRSRDTSYLSAGTYTQSTKDGVDVYDFKPDNGKAWSATIRLDGSMEDPRGTWNLESSANGISSSPSDIFKALRTQ
jgi:hypothetical protein